MIYIVFRATSQKLVNHFVCHMSTEFEMSLIGELTYFLGLQVNQKENHTFASQSIYAKGLVKKIGMESTTHRQTSIGTHDKISRDEKEKYVDQTLYWSMIGSLIYLIASRPDLCCSVGICARYHANPKESHLALVKKIIKYVNKTIEFGLWYSCDSIATLMSYCDTH